MDLILVFKFRLGSFSLCRKKDIEIKSIKFTSSCHFTYRFWKLVSKHYHSRKCRVRIIISCPLILCSLFIRICPIKNLLFYKFTIFDSTKRCSRKIEIMTCSYWHSFLIKILKSFSFSKYLFFFIFTFK